MPGICCVAWPSALEMTTVLSMVGWVLRDSEVGMGSAPTFYILLTKRLVEELRWQCRSHYFVERRASRPPAPTGGDARRSIV
jgi:hypothetical protein